MSTRPQVQMANADELTPAWCLISQPPYILILYQHNEKRQSSHLSLTNPVHRGINDFLKKLVVSKLQLDVAPKLDAYQFTRTHQRGTDDATNGILHLVTKHVENPRVCRLQFSL